MLGPGTPLVIGSGFEPEILTGIQVPMHALLWQMSFPALSPPSSYTVTPRLSTTIVCFVFPTVTLAVLRLAGVNFRSATALALSTRAVTAIVMKIRRLGMPSILSFP